jgi:Calcineurin-like phosphoesterase
VLSSRVVKRLVRLVVLVSACRASDTIVFEDAFVAVDAPTRIGAGVGGGVLTDLRFAVVGDTRPATVDDTAHYPVDIVTTIWTAVQSAQPQFAITTGDYMFASTNGIEQLPQLDLYLGARSNFDGVVYPALGNHECTSATTSNCGDGNADGEPANYHAYIDRLLAPIGETKPYFIERFAAADGTWSAKFVFVAANSWSATQAAWLDAVLSQSTTYTFVVRHEPHEATAAPGVPPSNTIILKHPLTLLAVGHIHTYRHDADSHELLVGNGGAPLSTAVDYGYTIVARRVDGSLVVDSYDYLTKVIIDEFAIAPDGTSL